MLKHLLPFLLLIGIQLDGQNHFFGGQSNISPHECLSEQLRHDIIAQNKANSRALNLPIINDRSIVLMDWPLKQAAGFNDNSYYIISNFVDHNSTTGLTDYNCGTRTYNGHKGTDIVTWPYMWDKQKVGQVEVIAGQSGIIINKSDGNFDLNCTCTGTWNAVYIQHIYGSVAWYGHLKKGSLTAKSIGQSVVKGEYLGIVGSSGCSTAPHLHLELYTNGAYTNLIDPFGGSCNSLNNTTSWWSNQHPYLAPKLLDIMAHDCTNLSQPDGCPSNEYKKCESYQFTPGSKATFSSHFRQQNNTLPAIYTIRKPDNTVWQTWSNTSGTTYTYGSWWYSTYNLPTDAPLGNWTYEVTYNGDTVQKTFEVIPTNINNIGIGTNSPATKLHVSQGDIYVDNVGSGVIIKSLNGGCWRLTVQNDGTVTSVSVICP